MPSDDLLNALADRPDDAEIVTPTLGTETASEVGLGQLVEVYVPLRFASSGPPEGAFEIYLSYRPIAAAIAHDKSTIALIVAIGLALLWAMLFPIVVGASRRLRRQARENHRLARYDQLTGLPNRTLFIEAIGRELRRHRSRPDDVAVLLIDIDRFTEINNTLGRANGDLVLLEVARRLRARSRRDAHVARLGADEYALAVRGHRRRGPPARSRRRARAGEPRGAGCARRRRRSTSRRASASRSARATPMAPSCCSSAPTPRSPAHASAQAGSRSTRPAATISTPTG